MVCEKEEPLVGGDGAELPQGENIKTNDEEMSRDYRQMFDWG